MNGNDRRTMLKNSAAISASALGVLGTLGTIGSLTGCATAVNTANNSNGVTPMLFNIGTTSILILASFS